MTGFSNPIIGGGGALVYPSIHSPDFTLSPITGWSIDKDGTAYFSAVIVGSGQAVIFRLGARQLADISLQEFIGSTDFWLLTFGLDFAGVVGWLWNERRAMLAPSNDATGATDTTAVSTLLAQGIKEIQLLAGQYYINAAITLPAGACITGAGSATVITQTSAILGVFSASAASNITIARMWLQGQGVAGTGNGIDIVAGANPNVESITIEDVIVAGFGNTGIHLDTPIASRLTRCRAESNGGDGFQLSNTAGTPTSTVLDACYANHNAGFGFELDSAGYCALNACAADNQATNYALFSCQGVALNGCGSETFTTAGWEFNDCQSCSLIGARTFHGKGKAIWITGGTTRQTVASAIETSPSAGATAFIETDAGTSTVVWGITHTTADSLGGTVTNVDASA